MMEDSYHRHQLDLDELECSNIGRDPRFAGGGWLGPLIIAATILAAIECWAVSAIFR